MSTHSQICSKLEILFSQSDAKPVKGDTTTAYWGDDIAKQYPDNARIGGDQSHILSRILFLFMLNCISTKGYFCIFSHTIHTKLDLEDCTHFWLSFSNSLEFWIPQPSVTRPQCLSLSQGAFKANKWSLPNTWSISGKNASKMLNIQFSIFWFHMWRQLN